MALPVDLTSLKLPELRKLAAQEDIEGRSEMNKDELQKALLDHQAATHDPQQHENRDDPAAQVENPAAAPAENYEPADLPTPDQVGPEAVAREEYDRVVNENQQLRAQLQYQLQGAVGAPNRFSPDPGVL